MIVKLPLPKIDYLRECFHYDREDGILYWKKRPKEHFNCLRTCNMWNAKFSLKKAGATNTSGHRQLKLDHRSICVHRIIYAIEHNFDPGDLEIDHIDRDKQNNKISNLRLANRQMNMANIGIRLHNKSGYSNVYWHKQHKKWCVSFKVKGKNCHIGLFRDKLEAAIAANKVKHDYLLSLGIDPHEYTDKTAPLTDIGEVE